MAKKKNEITVRSSAAEYLHLLLLPVITQKALRCDMRMKHMAYSAYDGGTI